MALLIDETGDFDVEIVDEWFFVYARHGFDLSNATLWRRLERIRHVVGAKAITQTDLYANARDPAAIAEGSRLRMGFFSGRSKIGVKLAFILVLTGRDARARFRRVRSSCSPWRADVALEPVYVGAIAAGRAMFGMLRVRREVHGAENLPDTGGAVLAITHFGYLEFAIVEWITYLHNRRHIRFMAKKAAFKGWPLGALMRGMKHIPVDRAAGAGRVRRGDRGAAAR